MGIGKWRIYALIALGFVLGLLRWRSVGIAQAEAKLRAAQATDAVKRRREMDNATLNVSGNPDDARQWLLDRDRNTN